MNAMLRLSAAATFVALAGCNSIGPQYKGAALEGIVVGQPRIAEAALPEPKALTIGLITSDATEQTLDYLAKSQKSISENIFSENIRKAAASYDPKLPVTYVVDMLQSRFGRVQLISDMNQLASLPKPSVACVLDLRITGQNDLAGQRVTGTSELWFLDGAGTVTLQIKGSGYTHNPGGASGQAAQRAWMTVQSSTLEQAMEDMRKKLDQKLTATR